jgi:hypothetical protein
MAQVTRSAFVCREPSSSLAALRRTFDESHVVHLREFLHRDLLSSIQAGVRSATFSNRSHEDIAREDCMADDATVALLWLAMNDPAVFRFIELVTGCPTIRVFSGRVYMMRGEADHYDRWHSDLSDDRVIGMSLNLSEDDFYGGRFQLTHRGKDDVEVDIANTGRGDAILFRIDDALVHRVTAVEGDVPRVAYAGWFQLAPDFLGTLKSSSTNATAPSVEVQ